MRKSVIITGAPPGGGVGAQRLALEGAARVAA